MAVLECHPQNPKVVKIQGYLRAPSDQNICLGHLRRKQLSISLSHPEKVVVYLCSLLTFILGPNTGTIDLAAQN